MPLPSFRGAFTAPGGRLCQHHAMFRRAPQGRRSVKQKNAPLTFAVAGDIVGKYFWKRFERRSAAVPRDHNRTHSDTVDRS